MERRLRAGITLLVVLHVLAAWLCPATLWGVSQFAALPLWLAVLWTLVALAALWAPAVAPRLGHALTFPGGRATWVAAVAAGILFWLLREPTHFFGDGYLLIRARGLTPTSERAPALVGFVVHIVRGAQDHFGVPMEAALAGLAVAAGIAAVAIGVRLCAAFGEAPETRLAALALLATAGASQLFFGHVEYYPALVPALFLYLWLAVRGMTGHGPLWPPWLLFPLLPSLHLSMLALGPAQLYLAFVAWRRAEWRRAALAFGVGSAAAILLTRLAGGGEQRLAHEAVGGLAQYIRPYFDAANSRHAFGFVSLGHLLAVLDDLLLVAPMALVALLAFGRDVDSNHAGVRRFFGWAAAGCLALDVAFNREVGPYRDWDILAWQGWIFLAWCASRMPRLAPARARSVVALLFIGGTFHLVPWLALHAVPGAALRHLRIALGAESNWSPYARGYMHEEIAIFLRGKGDLPAAAAEYRAAVAANPADARYHASLAAVLGAIGQHDEAIREYETALRHRPDYYAVHNSLALGMVAERRDPEAARQHAEAAVHGESSNPDYWVTYGIVLEYAQRWDEAQRAYEQAVRLSPKDPRVATRRLLELQRRRSMATAQPNAPH